ncbi:MAG TPA: tyrosine--tRNA ligase [Rhodospirillaceae bacterium]|nr:MAG: tyrosine--tRNA ligase [Alphaproteobacteria bacterium GWF2_58_20]HAU29914.1 tyrosine--tRNA ligase [Rhodospirillaceae bacterium]
MTEFQSSFLKAFSERGFLNQCTDLEGLDTLMAEGPIVAYTGYDATADSLHVGNLTTIMMLRLLQKCGHKPVVLVGGATTKLGDPSGKTETRKMLSEEDIAHNIAGIKACFEPFLTFGDGPTDAVIVNNDDWLGNMNYLTFLREVGRHFSVNRMLSFDSVKLRLEREQQLTFLEFNYMLLQAYDFVELYGRMGCRLQMAGSDQWGNIVSGVELARRFGKPELYGLTCPLLTTSSGAKMGKSVSGAVWIRPDHLSPYEYYQFWRNTEDLDVVRFMKLYTDMPMDEVNRLAAMDGAEINEAKKILAYEATKLCHGKEAADLAAETARRVFEEGGVAEGLPEIFVSRNELAAGIAVTELLVRAGLVASNGEARRLIRGGGAKINDAVVADEVMKVTDAVLNEEGFLKLSSGRKKHVMVRVAD